MDEVKQVILVRKDLKMSEGKMAAQVAHASVMSYMEASKKDEKVTRQWLDSGQKKIVIGVENEEALLKFYKAFKHEAVPCAIVNDAGLTQLPAGTTTTVGIGPDFATKIDRFTKGLKLL